MCPGLLKPLFQSRKSMSKVCQNFPFAGAKTVEMVHSNSHPKNIICMFLMNFPINTWTPDLTGSNVQLRVSDQTLKD